MKYGRRRKLNASTLVKGMATALLRIKELLCVIVQCIGNCPTFLYMPVKTIHKLLHNILDWYPHKITVI